MLAIQKRTPSPSAPNIKNKDFLWLENNKNILNTWRGEKTPKQLPCPNTHTFWKSAIFQVPLPLGKQPSPVPGLSVCLSVPAGHVPDRVVFLCVTLPPTHLLSSSVGHFTFATLKLHFNLATFPSIISSSFLFLHFGEYCILDLLDGFSILHFPPLFVFWLYILANSR